MHTLCSLRDFTHSSDTFYDMKLHILLFFYSIVSTSKGNKILTKEEFNTYNTDGKIDIVYGTRMKQGGGEMKDYNDITYVLKE